MIDNWTCIYGTSLSDSATCSPFHSALRPVARHRRCSGEKMLSLDFAQLQAESVIPEPWSSVHLEALYSDCSSSSSLCCRYRSSLLSEVSKITSCSHNLFQYLYEIIVNGESKLKEVNLNPKSYANVLLYTSSPWSQPFTSEFGSICNFTVEHDIGETVIATTTTSSISTTISSTASAGE